MNDDLNSIIVNGLGQNTDALPRADLREDAFRKYEPYLARAVQGTIEIDPRKVTFNSRKSGGQSPATFMARLRDAILGYRRYGYKSTAIPQGFDFGCLEIVETLSGMVRIINKLADARNVDRNRILNAANKQAVAELADKLGRYELEGPYTISYATEEEKTFVFELRKTRDIDIWEPKPGLLEMR